MKPLPSAPLTDEDYSILTWGPRSVLSHEADQLRFRLDRISDTQDRRDAALMLQAQVVARFGPAAIELYGIPCRGWNDYGYWIENTDDGEGVWCRY